MFSLFSLADCVLISLFFFFLLLFFARALCLGANARLFGPKVNFSLVRCAELCSVDGPAAFWQAVPPPGCLNDTGVLEVCILFAYFTPDRIGYTNWCCSN